MSQALCFNDVQFDVIHQNSQPWVRGSQIATALQYASVQRIIELYTRHAEEFTDTMTAVVTLPTKGGPQETRFGVVRNIVRLGCHPGSKTMRMKSDEREAYEILHNLYVAADESLCAAYNALDAGYKLGRLHGRG